MSFNRRDFLKTLGVAGSSLLVTRAQGTELEKKGKEFYGMLIDTTLCEGCQTCEVVCAEANGLPEPDPDDYPEVDISRKLSPDRFTVVNCFETSKGEVYVKKQCMHCNQPACDAACLTKAMSKTEEGPVIWNSDKCMGCRYCMISCPFDVPKFEYDKSIPSIRKCSMCWSRQQEGMEPACVENCPAEAIMFGTRKQLIQEARKRIYQSPGQYYDHIYGEHEAGGTGLLYLSAVPFEELGFNTTLDANAYPEFTKGFLYSVPTIFVLWPIMLLGLYESTKEKESSDEGGSLNG